MRKISVVLLSILSTACSTVPEQREQQKELVKTVATVAVVLAVAGALGDSNRKSKCENNRAGFWQDHSTGKIYTCN